MVRAVPETDLPQDPVDADALGTHRRSGDGCGAAHEQGAPADHAIGAHT